MLEVSDGARLALCLFGSQIGNRECPGGVEMNMGWTRSWPACIAIAALFAHPLAAQSGPPRFTLPQRFLQPGQFLEIYGTGLAPSAFCNQPIPNNGSYPLKACDVFVTAGGLASGLLYVSPGQINVKLPENLPDAPEPVQICAGGLCSEPVVKDFSSHTAFIHVKEPAYVQMPIWIEVELPSPYRVSYPCRTDPWDFRSPSLGQPSELIDYTLEVRRGGVPIPHALPPKARIEWGPQGANPCMIWFNGVSRLPLHLTHKLDSPGVYSIRLTGSRGWEVVVQSAWTDIDVRPSSETVRDEWLRSMAEKTKSGQWGDLLRDVVPSLMSWPDAKALRVLLPLYLEWLQSRGGLVNTDIYVAAFLRNGLAAFDDGVLRSVVPASSLTVICPPRGNCPDNGQH